VALLRSAHHLQPARQMLRPTLGNQRLLSQGPGLLATRLKAALMVLLAWKGLCVGPQACERQVTRITGQEWRTR
jgi:hypothetical protein